MRACLLATLLLASGCAVEDELRIDVHTDLAVGAEFDEVEVTTSRGTLRVVAVSADWLGRGVRVGPLATGGSPETAVVRLTRARSVVVERTVRVEVRGATVISVWLVRACTELDCPEPGGDALATECDLGHCVRPECIDASDPGCGEAECLGASECPASGVACARAECREARCVAAPVPGACSALEWCDPSVGCVSVSIDAGPSDAGALDAGDDDASGLDASGCTGGLTRCGGACVDVGSDATHCGRCDDPCGASFRCESGGCVPVGCGAGELDCGGSCVASGTLAHCNSCTEDCAAAHLTTCTPAGCTGPCEPGWAECTAAPGCETLLGTLANCTGCGENCAAAHLTTCTAAGCTGPCEAGWAECTAAPGCETPLGTLTSCTSCSENCAAAHLTTCTAGGCAGPCAPGWCDFGPGPGCETPC